MEHVTRAAGHPRLPLIESLERRALLSGGGAAAHAAMPALHDGPGHAHAQPLHHAGGGQRASATAVRKFEVRYMTQMIDHHHMAVMMGEMAVEKAVHPELEELGQDIIDAQTAEIEKMQGWLEDWYGIDYEPQMTKRDQRQMDRLEALSGEGFEVAFLTQMIRHHRMAVMMSRPVARKAGHLELRELAKDVIEAQTAEIELMRSWLQEWYGVGAGGAGGHHGGGHGGGHG